MTIAIAAIFYAVIHAGLWFLMRWTARTESPAWVASFFVFFLVAGDLLSVLT